MITKKVTQDFIELYERNGNALNEWNERLLQKKEPGEWMRMLTERSGDIRRIFDENVKALETFKQSLPQGKITPDEADTLYESVEELYFKGIHDYSIIAEIAEKILPYFEEKKDFEKTLFLSHVIGYEYINFYRYDPNMDPEIPVSYYRRAIGNRIHYREIENPAIRGLDCC